MTVLSRYRQQHAPDRQQTIGFSDSLVRLFGDQYPVVGTARNAGLAGLDILPGAKYWFARRAMGLTAGSSARQPSDRDREQWQ
jgi:2-octaprenyl-6-methoxyphenol hydroxylase